jgi:hypothetical protein
LVWDWIVLVPHICGFEKSGLVNPITVRAMADLTVLLGVVLAEAFFEARAVRFVRKVSMKTNVTSNETSNRSLGFSLEP